jgi:hypothetical protein
VDPCLRALILSATWLMRWRLDLALHLPSAMLSAYRLSQKKILVARPWVGSAMVSRAWSQAAERPSSSATLLEAIPRETQREKMHVSFRKAAMPAPAGPGFQ